MNLFDVIIIGIVSFCLIRGIFRGLIRECVSLIGLVAGFCVASHYYAWIAKILSNWISNEIYLRILGFFSLFLGIVFIINLTIPVIKYILGLDFIRSVDRSFGGGIGMTKGIIVSCILLIIFTAFLPKGTSIISDSQLLRPLTPFSEKLLLLAHEEMKREFYEKIKNYKKAAKYYRGHLNATCQTMQGEIMSKNMNVPSDLQKSFSSLINLIPVPFRYEEKVQKDILLFLKLEGEEFVRNKIEHSKEVFSEKNQDSSVEV